MKEKKFNQPSVMSAQQHFSAVPSADIQRSRFDRSHAYKTTFDAGLLIPVFVDEVLPGDTFSLSATVFGRLATPLKPIMDNIYLDTHFFFVPNRLIWDNWQKFMGERVNPADDPSVYTIPQTTISLSTSPYDSMARYLGIPYRNLASTVDVSALPFRAIALIWNEWFRDQNLQDSIVFSTGNGPDSWNTVMPYRRGKRHDYFTSCLPWPQKGSAVTIPIGNQAPVRGIGVINTYSGAVAQSNVRESGGGTRNYSLALTTTPFLEVTQATGAAGGAPTIYADLSAATSISINDLRTAFQVQRLLERDARGGTRYIELILSHFGVHSPDARLQRPEFLGGGTTRVNVNPVAATVPEATVPQGNLAGVGTAVGRGGFSKSFTEHGFVIGFVSARADLTYQQGIDRGWFRRTRYDYYWPALAHLGEQAVLNREIFVQGSPTDLNVFGYQERYAEYRYKPSKITGLFASDVASSLDVWHLSQDFGGLPALNNTFIQDNPPIDRVIAVPTEPHFLCDIWFDFKCDRPMPVYSVPGFIDHF